MDSSITIDISLLLKFLLVAIAVYLALRMFFMKWSYKISKPHKWEEAIKNKKISKTLQKIERTYRDKVRFYTFWLQIERLKTERVEGSFAELGVYKGETAKFIHEMDKSRSLRLFDTFEGFKNDDLKFESSTDKKYNIENFSDTSYESVKDYINGNENVNFHPGYFPDSTIDLNAQKYAFVHLDADLYKPTLAALEYFYPMMSPGGVIIIHDYNHTWEGLTKSVNEFSKKIPESIIEISDWQGSAMIIRNKNN